MYSETKVMKMAKLEEKQDLELKDKDIEIQKLRFDILVICIVLLLFVVFYGIYKLYKQGKSSELLAKEKSKHVKKIDSQNKMLERISHIQSHDLRGPLCTIMGLSQLFNYEKLDDPENAALINGIEEVVKNMDQILTNIIKEENKMRRD